MVNPKIAVGYFDNNKIPTFFSHASAASPSKFRDLHVPSRQHPTHEESVGIAEGLCELHKLTMPVMIVFYYYSDSISTAFLLLLALYR